MENETKDYYKKLSFSLKEEEIIRKLEIPRDIFLPLLFSIKFGGDWSFKTNSIQVMAIKEKITRYDDEKKLGYTLEKIFLFLNPVILEQEGEVHRLEKCGNKKEREIVKRPFKIEIDAEFIIRAMLDPLNRKISLKKVKGPFKFTGANAYGIAHEMEHLIGDETKGIPLWKFEYSLEEE